MPDQLDPGQLVDIDELRAVLNLTGNALYPDALYQRVAAAASELLEPYLAPLPDGQDYTAVPAVREAALSIAVELWQHRVSPGGAMQAADFTPGPYRLSRGLITRVSGLIAQQRDVGGLIG